MVHSGVLYISGRPRGPKCCGAWVAYPLPHSQWACWYKSRYQQAAIAEMIKYGLRSVH